MACSSRLVWLLAATAMAVTFLPAPASAENYQVGGATGWNLSYTIGWPEGKTFRVGDSLVFNYTKGEDTVTEVDSEAFRECNRQGNVIKEWSSGSDVVALDKAGRRWFFSSLANHCDLGLKLVVDVAAAGVRPPGPEPEPAPAPAPLISPVPPPLPAPAPAPPVSETPPSPDTSSAALNHYKIDEAAVAWAARCRRGGRHCRRRARVVRRSR